MFSSVTGGGVGGAFVVGGGGVVVGAVGSTVVAGPFGSMVVVVVVVGPSWSVFAPALFGLSDASGAHFGSLIEASSPRMVIVMFPSNHSMTRGPRLSDAPVMSPESFTGSPGGLAGAYAATTWSGVKTAEANTAPQFCSSSAATARRVVAMTRGMPTRKSSIARTRVMNAVPTAFMALVAQRR